MNKGRFFTIIASLSLISLSVACGGEGGEGGGAEAGAAEEVAVDRYTEVYGDTPPIDCADYAQRVNQCPDFFLRVYATTEAAATAGEGDGAQGAEYYRGALEVVELTCSEFYVNKDPHWHHRYNECLSLEGCDAWAECAAKAIGDPVGPPDLGEGGGG